jgi:cell division protein FtsB
MTANRKKGERPVRFGPLFGLVLAFLFASGAGLGYVWHRNRNAQLSRQVAQKRAELEAWRLQNQTLERQMEVLRSHPYLLRRVQELNLGLVMPQPEQILRLPANPTAAPLPPPAGLAPARFAARAAGQ